MADVAAELGQRDEDLARIGHDAAHARRRGAARQPRSSGSRSSQVDETDGLVRASAGGKARKFRRGSLMLDFTYASCEAGNAVTPARSARSEFGQQVPPSAKIVCRSGPGHEIVGIVDVASEPFGSERYRSQCRRRGPAPGAAQSCRRRSSARSGPGGASPAMLVPPSDGRRHQHDRMPVEFANAPPADQLLSQKRQVGRNAPARRRHDASSVLRPAERRH